MPRKSFLFGLALAVVMAVLVFASVDAKPKKKRSVERASGPPALTLAAEPTTVVNSRGIDASRFNVTTAAAQEDWLFELWIVPAGATPPTPSR